MVLSSLGLCVWLYMISTVQGINCGVPGRPVDGWYAPAKSEYLPGTRVQYFCDPRNLIFGPDTRICVNGSWSNDIPVCEKPIKVREAFQSSTLGNYTAANAIDMNYESYSSTGLQENAYWIAVLHNQTLVTAIRVSLPLAKEVFLDVSITNSSVRSVSCGKFEGNTGTDTTKVFYCPADSIGSRIRIDDYLNAPDSLQLREVEIFVRKVVPCLIPDLPANGIGAKKSSGTNSSYHYFCAKGYVLKGNNATWCHPDGTWKPHSPVCEEAFCDIPPQITAGNIRYITTNQIIPYKGFVNYSCNHGYHLQGESSRQCLGQNVWSHPKPKCVAIHCGNLSFSILNGYLQFNSVTVNSVALLRCNEGYRPLKDDRLTCQSNGRWSQSLLRCAPIRCNESTVIPHAKIKLLDQSTYYGSRMQIICDPGYKLFDDQLRMCDKNGNWGDLQHACVGITCSPFPVLDMEVGHWMQMNTTDVMTVGTRVILECYPGYDITGEQHTSTCLSNGSWSQSYASCTKNSAHPIWRTDLSPRFMMITAMGVGIGSAIFILCVVVGIFLFRKRSHCRNPPPVFHVGIENMLSTDERGLLSPGSPTESHYYATAIYEEVEQRRPPSLPRQRKPCSALPPTPPLDSDPVYSQPFEEQQTNKKGEEQNHIYAEPVDACGQQNEANTRKEEPYNHLYEKANDDNIMENNCIYKIGDMCQGNTDMVRNDIYCI